jgi:hypothetical protein
MSSKAMPASMVDRHIGFDLKKPPHGLILPGSGKLPNRLFSRPRKK